MQTAGLIRITIATPRRRIDMALPDHASVAELLPGVLARAGEGMADKGVAGGGWLLRRDDGTAFDLNRTLGAYRVRDGEILHLTSARTNWPEPEYDDLADAIATGSGRTGKAWGPRHTRRAGLAVGAFVVLLGLVAVMRAGPPWTGPGLCALATAVALLVAGVILARPAADADAGAVLAATALPFAFAAGVLIPAGSHAVTDLTPGHVLLAGAALLLAALVGYLGVAVAQAVFAGAAALGLFTLIGGLVSLLWDLAAHQAAGVLAAGLLLLSTMFAPLALRLGKVPMPVLPRTTADLVRDDPQPSLVRVHAAVARADGLLTGMLGGAAVAVIAGEALLTADGGMGSMVLLAVLTVGFLLRARLYPVPRQRIPLLLIGVFGLGCLVAGPFTMPLAATGVLLPAVAAGVIAAGILLSTRAANPYLGRFAEYSEILVLAAVVPMACWVLGLYAYVRGLGG
ncbi:type VII secretion integral membrane protein EccD [Amycolatopsis acidicola]|uniref:Type VII secretion integral membrane protein EccD n=1 Tax=Amycolatopsis acidicola TaxID=2596893 RepID=A0A5N0UXI5_9PSEU|nr:type VII secretion integral membrane protein EccD [Amycolatopsis acidicola]KAA9155800.1 type VII secretion integral membrane protein EccD [Amycolatopsis acidicola]